MKPKTPTIKKNETNPEPDELIAKAIIEIADGAQRLRSGKLTMRAIKILLREISGVKISEIEKVLDALPRLREFVK